ncbi:MAG: hypothetical protein ABTD50_01365 [Polyangiaceae bacterium]
MWNQKERVFHLLHDALKPGGVAVIWEPAWPTDIARLREPRGRAMGVQNLSEYVQGNHFLQPAEIEAAFIAVGMKPRTTLFGGGFEAVVVAARPR